MQKDNKLDYARSFYTIKRELNYKCGLADLVIY